jgi:hypothetical protein
MWLQDLYVRFWHEIAARPGGPLAFRFLLQPAVAGILAVRDGWHDAETSRSPYLWAMLHDPRRGLSRLREGLMAVSRVLLLGIAMDLLYQLIVLHAVRPVQTLVVALGLAFLPYLLLRGPVARIGRLVLHRRERTLHSM